jgi:hypothetical protein
MDNREESFKRKFCSAGQHLKVPFDQIVSLKFRENVISYDDYRKLVELLRHEAGINFSEIDGDLQGRGYLLQHEKANLLLVEHETGLEILYIAGSVASLLGMIPLVLQGWAAIRGLLPRHGAPIDHRVEIRRFDDIGHLHEEHLPSHRMQLSLMQVNTLTPALLNAATFLEHENSVLIKRVEVLTRRIEALETKVNKEDTKDKSRPHKSPKKAMDGVKS